METVLRARPARGPLRRLVAGFRERRGAYPSAGVKLPLPARTEQFIERSEEHTSELQSH